MSECIVATTADAVLSITLKRPERRNALTQPMYAALIDRFETAAADDAVRAIHLRGAGGNFCAGNDLNDFRDALAGSDEAPPVLRFLHTVVDFPKPLIAEVSGHAVGIGTTLLLHCDAVIAATDCRFRLPFVPLGLVPEFGSSRLFRELAGVQQASRWLLTGEPFDVSTAERLGLLSQICEPPALESVTAVWCRRFAVLPPRALAAARGLLRDAAWRRELHEHIDAEWDIFRRRLNDPEHRAALEAFFRARGG